ncbi:unnamed protein product [Owenia fusiformis]|uniref:Flavin-containing monooxygenase n=1 Tax=Owenia fusiformis TaxID=6347 RepID=A0A8J1XSU8_OWEFU|nr:unnamed protein product [Owenia fusiformis]
MHKKKVCVIGAGASGLAAVKWCLQEGLDVICYDKRPLIGGLWSLENEDSRNDSNNPANIQCRPYASCITNDNKEALSYSDFRFPKDVSMYISAKRLGKFFEDYADTFKLRPHINLNTQVVNVKREINGSGWVVTTKLVDTTDSEGVAETVDAVVICTGIHNRQYIPNVNGLGSFKGRIVHSGDYYKPEAFRGQNVLIVGGSNSAAEIACDISKESNQAYLSARCGLWPLARLAGGIPGQLMPPWSRYTNMRYDLRYFDKLFGPAIRQRFNFEDYSMEPKRGLLRMAVAVCDDIEFRIAAGALKMKGSIKQITETGVKFEDGSQIDDIDAFVFATGYRPCIDFLEDPVVGDIETMHLYKHILPVEDESHSLFLIGHLQIVGGAIPCFELQARVAVRIIAEKLELPSKEVMKKCVEDDRRRIKDIFGDGEYSYKIMEFYPKYIESIADVLDVRPTPWRIFLLYFTDPKLAHQLLFGFPLAACFRLYGPHSNWDEARKYIMESEDNLMRPLRTVQYANETKGFLNKGTVCAASIATGLIAAFVWHRIFHIC